LKFVTEKFPKYTVFYKPLQKRLVGVKNDLIFKVRKPEENQPFQQETLEFSVHYCTVFIILGCLIWI